jgi:hypothetical protein
MRFLLHQIIIFELSCNAKVADIIEDGGSRLLVDVGPH